MHNEKDFTLWCISGMGSILCSPPQISTLRYCGHPFSWGFVLQGQGHLRADIDKGGIGSFLWGPALTDPAKSHQVWRPTVFPVPWLVISQSCSKWEKKKIFFFSSLQLTYFSSKRDNMRCSQTRSYLVDSPAHISSTSATTLLLCAVLNPAI